LLACIFGFLSRDAAGATAMGIFAANWGVFATFWLSMGPVQSPALGVFSVTLTASILCLAIVARKAKPLLAVLLLIAAVRDAFLAAFQLGATGALEGVGICGLILTPFSLYGGLAFLLEDVNQRTVLPVLRRGPAKTSMEGNLAEQLQRIEQETGVRNQL
jgi:succinate-acetate transporter protein